MIIKKMSFVVLLCTAQLFSITKRPHLTQWYPTDAKALQALLEEFDQQAENHYAADDVTDVRAIIVPHAGYSYSGLVAATAFRLLDPEVVTKVILLAPCHGWVPVDSGAFVMDEDRYDLPTGTVPLDKAGAQKVLQKSKGLVTLGSSLGQANPFNHEHAMEIELPFIHFYLPNVPVLPLIINHHLQPEQIRSLAKTVRSVIDDTTVVVVSSDFIHHGKEYGYQPFANDGDIFANLRTVTGFVLQPLFAQSLDRFLGVLRSSQATVCGQAPLSLLLALFEEQAFGKEKLEGHLIDYATSGDGAKKRDSYVTYAAIAFGPASDEVVLTSYEQASLRTLIRTALKARAQKGSDRSLDQPISTPNLEKRAGTFVTLTNPQGALRGCIGTITPTEELWRSLRSNALKAGFEDSRFVPVTAKEVDTLGIQCSLLSKPIKASLDQIFVGDGVILTLQGRTALFLPEVGIAQGWSKDELLNNLALKAGFPPSAWKDKNAQFQKFYSVVF